MSTVRAPYPSELDEINARSITAFERDASTGFVTFRDRAGGEQGTFQIRNPGSAFVKAIRRIGNWEVGYKDILIKGWARTGQPNVKVDDSAFTFDFVGSIEWSPDSKYLATGSASSPYVVIYKHDGDTFTKVSNPSTLPTSPSQGFAWSPDSRYLFITGNAPEYRLYSRTIGTNTFTFARQGTSLLSALPNGNPDRCIWSRDGWYLAIATDASPWVTVYKRNDSVVTAFTKLANLPSNPGIVASDIAWSNDSQHLAIGTYTDGSHTKSLHVYKRSGDSFTKLFSITPGGGSSMQSRGLAYRLDDEYLAVGLNGTPYLSVFRRDGDTYTELGPPSVGGDAYVTGDGVDWSPDGQYVITANMGGANHGVWKFENEVLTRKENLGTPLPGNGYATRFSSDGKYLAIAHYNSPYLIVYKSAMSPISGAAMRIDPNTSYPG